MKWFGGAVLLFCMFGSMATADDVYFKVTSPEAKSEVVEGQTTTICWYNTNPLVVGVSALIEYRPCALGGKQMPIKQLSLFVGTPVVAGKYDWQVPHLDTLELVLKIKIFSMNSTEPTIALIPLRFRPKALAGMTDDLILVDKTHQRLYLQKGGEILLMYWVSTGIRSEWTPAMVTHIFSRCLKAWSARYRCLMPYWNAITANGKIGIHETPSKNYRLLGHPASHGCIRLHGVDAKVLFGQVSVGFKVIVVN